MNKKTLGRTGLEVSVVGFGGIPIQRVERTDVKGLFDYAMERGINFIDTARGYTVSEEVIGEAIEGNRGHWILATKSASRDYEGMKADIETSLKNLRTDHIELYQLHFVKDMATYDQVMGDNGAYKALLEAKEAGKIGYIGITGHDAKVLEYAVPTGYFDTVQFPYNPIEYQGENLFKIAHQLNVGTIVMKPIAGGALERGEISIKYILQNENITTAIPGMDSIEVIDKNTADDIVNGKLTGEDIDLIESVKAELGETFCRRCGYCDPCPEGINIAGQFLIEGYLLRYKLNDWAVDRFKGLDKTAKDCVQCGACEPRCPYDLPIQDMLKKTAKTFERALKE